ncbi:MAG: hypothetical protein RI897_1041 [Verrucomicrobiota bacterium]|jgi:uncharacterized protein (DUF362 family)
MFRKDPASMFPGKAPQCPGGLLTRRHFLQMAAGAAAALPAAASVVAAPAPPRSPVSLHLCPRYDYSAVKRELNMMFDEIGGVGRLVRRKHVTVKVNLVNSSQADLAGIPLSLTVIVHPVVAQALGALLVQYGARSVTFTDQLPFRETDQQSFLGYGFNLAEFNAAMEGKARFENTRNLGRHSSYAWVKTPGTPELATAWEVNRTYTDTDVLISLAKLKSHVSGGVTAGMKNLFGIPPSSLYGDDLKSEPDENAMDYRSGTMHNCSRLPLTSAASFNGKSIEGDHGHNVPRFIVDLAAAFPIDLVVIDAISTIQSAEGWWMGSMVRVTRPGLLIAGRNAVCTDAVAASAMGFDPTAPDRTWPFVNGTNYLALARNRGLGENRLSNIETVGTPLDKARFGFEPTYRRTAS